MMAYLLIILRCRFSQVKGHRITYLLIYLSLNVVTGQKPQAGLFTDLFRTVESENGIHIY
jgi:hypothetical protein